MNKSSMGGDVAALHGLLSIVNMPNMPGIEVPAPQLSPVKPEEQPSITDPQTTPPLTPIQTLIKSEIKLDRVFFTGRTGVGKDYCATAAGFRVVGFAEPIYYLARHFFNDIQVDANNGKDLPGMRTFLQAAGQWGRGAISEQYPLTPVRACFVTMIRSLASAGVLAGFGVDWKQYGGNPDLWLEATLRRIAEEGANSPVAVTNVRFGNEFKRLTEEGWSHWHVVCSTNTWRERLAKNKLTTESPQVRDMSEKLAASLDADVTKKISSQPNGPKFHVIWNDAAKPPSSRLYTLAEWLAVIKTNQTTVVTGE